MADASCRIVRASLKTAQFREGSVPERITTCTITLPPERRGRWQAYGCRVITCASDFCNNNANTEHDAAVEVLPLFHGGSSTQQRSWERRGEWGAPEKHQHSPKSYTTATPSRPPLLPSQPPPGPRFNAEPGSVAPGFGGPPPAWPPPGSPPGPPAASCCSWVRAPAPRTSRGTARPRFPPRRSAPSSREPLPSRVQSAPLAPAGPTAARARRGQS